MQGQSLLRQYLLQNRPVHRDAQSNLGVLGVLMERGEANPALTAVWESVPPMAGAVRELGFLFDVNELLPADRTTGRYPG